MNKYATDKNNRVYDTSHNGLSAFANSPEDAKYFVNELNLLEESLQTHFENVQKQSDRALKAEKKLNRQIIFEDSDGNPITVTDIRNENYALLNKQREDEATIKQLRELVSQMYNHMPLLHPIGSFEDTWRKNALDALHETSIYGNPMLVMCEKVETEGDK